MTHARTQEAHSVQLHAGFFFVAQKKSEDWSNSRSGASLFQPVGEVSVFFLHGNNLMANQPTPPYRKARNPLEIAGLINHWFPAMKQLSFNLRIPLEPTCCFCRWKTRRRLSINDSQKYWMKYYIDCLNVGACKKAQRWILSRGSVSPNKWHQTNLKSSYF